MSGSVTGARYSTRLTMFPSIPSIPSFPSAEPRSGSRRSSLRSGSGSGAGLGTGPGAAVNQPGRTLSRSDRAVCPTAATTSAGVDRCSGSSRRQDSISGRVLSGTPDRSKSRAMTRMRITAS
ncbi:hypothetical protein [Streptomyces scabichelini]|uniref:hypothetical protein n=1 Tax=Streptomyces scabichelini TaxID=2711217 RepID=UPI0019D07CA2|nr:hypothetical protein [Streptomyces scabichelini]